MDDSRLSTAPQFRVLFACVENSNRSQMAEAFARIHGADVLVAASAGSRPSGRVNPRAIRAMQEIGYDLSVHCSKGLTEVGRGPWDVLITMGCGESCPSVAAAVREDWAVPDPGALDDDGYRLVHNEIESRVIALIERLRTPDDRAC